MTASYQLAYVQRFWDLANVFEEICTIGLWSVAQRHCQDLAIFQLGKEPFDIWPDVDNFQTHEIGHVAIDGIEAKHIKVFVIEIDQGHDFYFAAVFVAYDHTPIQGHLQIVLAYAQIHTGAVETFKKHQWHKEVIHIVLVTVVQNTKTHIVGIVGYLVEIEAEIAGSKYFHVNHTYWLTKGQV